ncbi:peptidoglycan DD-metalloendopeptidase family protein [Duganella sp. FT80W]|uniref:Peptidoglycan DD-metalloendopeptidase family protein n=1 Tax=Duganella guangzhouensis TaxID=2666084 RepID=A0A6I2KWU7_9BURK|nr:M23/M56 family metallopeptidase [Duganella guangzhouensis]MRW88449.1 peptidoglycan DD-metalloendopeptidase family protein [Duganella guangzhouensis]
MMTASVALVQWLFACASSVMAGLAVWLLLSGAARVWPALRTRRVVWLAAQAVVAGAALLPFAPHRADLSIAPSVTLTAMPAPTATNVGDASTAIDSATTARQAESPSHAIAAMAATATAPAAAAPAAVGATAAVLAVARTAAARSATDTPLSWVLPLLAALWLLVYGAGLTRAVVRQLRTRRVWRTLLASAQRLSPAQLQAHGAFLPAQLREISQHRLTVLRTEAAISPMLAGVFRPRLLLPAHLDLLSLEQQQMIVAHELHHWRARDPLWLGLAAVLQTLFWFNPALRWMAKQMEWALELHCDQQVLRGRPQQQRKQYAAALLQQWKVHTMLQPIGAAAFDGATTAARIRHMQRDGLPALSTSAAWLTGIALTAILATGVVLQPALAYSVAALPTPADANTHAAAAGEDAGATSATVTAVWRAPLDKVRVISFFGVTRSVPSTPHKGIDFAATEGTPVHATAAGTIIAAGWITENDGRYGKGVIIDHGGQRSLYAHLSNVNVNPGQQVQAGQLIGAVGQTGLATGPHLHLEMRQNSQIVDPAPMFANLDVHATARALRVRRQQLPEKR